ncbi:MAG: metallophosphoesterase [Acidobacteriaceae bacterium]
MTSTATAQEQQQLTRRQFIGLSGLAAGGGLVAYSGFWDRHHLELREQIIRLRRLPEAFHGMRIAQISDIHYDEFTEPYFVREVVGRINALNPDIVLLTGDFVTAGLVPRRVAARLSYPCAEILSGIQCPHRFASLGNHDALAGWEAVVDALKVYGTPTLVNSYLPFERDGSRLWFAGIRSSLEDVPDLDAALPRRATPGEPTILLAHEPDYALHVVKRGNVDFMLSGHTHGGQVHLPFIGTPRHMLPRGGRRFVHGHFDIGPLQLYVNRGIGTVKLPIRFLCPPELTLFTLQPAEA